MAKPIPALKAARERRGLTQAQISSQFDLTRQHLAVIEAGIRNASYGTIERICRALDGDVEPNDFFPQLADLYEGKRAKSPASGDSADTAP